MGGGGIPAGARERTQVGGVDPAELVAALGSRAALLHVKDGPADEPPSPMVAVGDGAVEQSRLAPGDVEVALGRGHAGIDRERAGERRHRLVLIQCEKSTNDGNAARTKERLRLVLREPATADSTRIRHQSN